MTEESLTEIYIDKLENSNNKIPIMIEFLRALFELEKVDPNLYKLIGRMINIYGYKIVFFSILDCVDVENVNIEGIQRLIGYFAKKRLSDKMSDLPVENLSSLAAKNLKELERIKRVKLPIIEWEEDVQS